MPCIRHFRSQTYHDFDPYKLLYKPLGWTTIFLIVLCPTATTYTVFSFRGRQQASYCTGYNCQCLVSGTLDHKPITILINTGSSISVLDEQLYCSLFFVPLLQPIQFSVSGAGADDRPLIALGITSLSIAIDDNTFQVQLVLTRNILFPVVLGINFLQTHGGIISFPTNQLYLTNSSPNPPTSLSIPIAFTIHTHHPYAPLHHAIPIPT